MVLFVQFNLIQAKYRKKQSGEINMKVLKKSQANFSWSNNSKWNGEYG